MSKKPEGWRAFDSLAKKLVQVPKEQVEAKQKKTAKRKKK